MGLDEDKQKGLKENPPEPAKPPELAKPGDLKKRKNLSEEAGGELAIESNTEHQTPESQKLQKNLQAELERLAEDEAEDEAKIKAASIKDIRFNTALLNGDENKVQEEMKHRLAQYTDKQTDGGLKLDYMKFNTLSGLDHEMEIGLGDVMPPEYSRILVITLDGKYRFGQRAIITHKGVERVGYRDEATGEYLATHSGDVVYVRSPPLADKAQLNTLLAKEKQTRKEGETTYQEYRERESSDSPSSDPSNWQQLTPEQKKTLSESLKGPITEKTIQLAAQECAKGTSIDKITNRPNLLKVIHYAAGKVKLPPYMIIAVLYHENGLSFPGKVGDGGKAIGMGQLHLEAWEDVKKTPLFQQIMSNYTQENPLTIGRGTNPLADILSVAIKLKKGAQFFNYDIDENTDMTNDELDKDGMTRMAKIRWYYHVPGHARAFANKDKYSQARVAAAEHFLAYKKNRYDKYSQTCKLAKASIDRIDRIDSQYEYAAREKPLKEESQADSGTLV